MFRESTNILIPFLDILPLLISFKPYILDQMSSEISQTVHTKLTIEINLQKFFILIPVIV